MSFGQNEVSIDGFDRSFCFMAFGLDMTSSEAGHRPVWSYVLRSSYVRCRDIRVALVLERRWHIFMPIQTPMSLNATPTLACERSLRSKRFREVSALISMFDRAKIGARAKKEIAGRGRGEKETLADKPLEFENPVRQRTGLVIGSALVLIIDMCPSKVWFCQNPTWQKKGKTRWKHVWTKR